jgi:hypothetical protein
MVSGPQVRAASVSSCTTAETWTAEISAELAQLWLRRAASAALAAPRLRAATQAPNFRKFIKTSFD